MVRRIARGGKRRGAARILVVDDEQHTRFALSLLLRKAGFRVAEADSGLDAEAMIAESIVDGGGFDLIIMDVEMSGLTGLEVVERMRARGVPFPVLIISGYRDKDVAGRLMGKDSVRYIEKPFEPDELMNDVALVLGRKKRTRARPAGRAGRSEQTSKEA